MVIEYVAGSEEIYCEDLQASYRLTFFVNGLRAFSTEEDHPLAKYKNYCCRVAANVPEGLFFTVGEYDSRFKANDPSSFWICETIAAEETEVKSKYGNGFVKGNYRVVVCADTPVKAARLDSWWNKGKKSTRTLAYAQHCARYLGERGLKTLPPMETQPTEEARISTVRLKPALDDRLKKIALRNNTSTDKIIEEALKDYLYRFYD
jgi:hypothetical protein